jgi:hypothetical protein
MWKSMVAPRKTGRSQYAAASAEAGGVDLEVLKDLAEPAV